MKMFLIALLIPILVRAEFLAVPQPVDHSKNSYSCRVFEPDGNGGRFLHYRVNPADQVATHPLQDGQHFLEMQWWKWTLNLSLHKIGVIPEVLGGATVSHIKLRSHSPDISVECRKE